MYMIYDLLFSFGIVVKCGTSLKDVEFVYHQHSTNETWSLTHSECLLPTGYCFDLHILNVWLQ